MTDVSDSQARRRSARLSLKREWAESHESGSDDYKTVVNSTSTLHPDTHHPGSSSEEKKRRKKRRSSFVNIVGRKSGDFLRPVNRLSDAIPRDLPEYERLEKLVVAAIDYALMNLQHENPDMDLSSVRDRFRDDSRDCVETLKQEGLFLKACGDNRRSENPVNVRNRELAAGYETKIKMFNKEAAAWDRQLEKDESQLAKAQKQVDEMRQHAVRVPPKSLTAHQSAMLAEAEAAVQNAAKMADDHRQVAETITTYLNKFDGIVDGLNRRYEGANSHLQHLTEKLYCRTRKNCPDPRDTISSLLLAWDNS